ncbi:hypothetical protein TWF694_005147 [Orbilia ellipsospora]|uniref:Uncharacterized protein n=1 Tax=Orbilia ellipsospora TaxID=2528407 RepID=A0AAV9WUW4_9PEZI
MAPPSKEGQPPRNPSGDDTRAPTRRENLPETTILSAARNSTSCVAGTSIENRLRNRDGRTHSRGIDATAATQSDGNLRAMKSRDVSPAIPTIKSHTASAEGENIPSKKPLPLLNPQEEDEASCLTRHGKTLETFEDWIAELEAEVRASDERSVMRDRGLGEGLEPLRKDIDGSKGKERLVNEKSEKPAGAFGPMGIELDDIYQIAIALEESVNRLKAELAEKYQSSE